MEEAVVKFHTQNETVSGCVFLELLQYVFFDLMTRCRHSFSERMVSNLEHFQDNRLQRLTIFTCVFNRNSIYKERNEC